MRLVLILCLSAFCNVVRKTGKIECLKTFGNHLKMIRKNKGFSQSEFEAKTNLSRSTISRIERAELNPTLSTRVIIAEGLDITVSELLDINF